MLLFQSAKADWNRKFSVVKIEKLLPNQPIYCSLLSQTENKFYFLLALATLDRLNIPTS